MEVTPDGTVVWEGGWPGLLIGNVTPIARLVGAAPQVGEGEGWMRARALWLVPVLLLLLGNKLDRI